MCSLKSGNISQHSGLGAFQFSEHPLLGKVGNEGVSQITEGVLRVIGSYRISRMRISNGKPFQLIEE